MLTKQPVRVAECDFGEGPLSLARILPEVMQRYGLVCCPEPEQLDRPAGGTMRSWSSWQLTSSSVSDFASLS